MKALHLHITAFLTYNYRSRTNLDVLDIDMGTMACRDCSEAAISIHGPSQHA